MPSFHHGRCLLTCGSAQPGFYPVHCAWPCRRAAYYRPRSKSPPFGFVRPGQRKTTNVRCTAPPGARGHLVSRWNATANIGRPAAVLIPPRIPATTPAFLVRESGRCSSVIRASERVDRNPRYGSKCLDFHDWMPAGSCQVDCRQFASRFSPARATSSHPMIQNRGGALHRSDDPDASPPSVEQPSLRLWTLRARGDRSKWKVSALFLGAHSAPHGLAWGRTRWLLG
jgi:hypothetical protein